MFRMEPHIFLGLKRLQVDSYGSHPIRKMCAKEALAMFLWTCTHRHSNPKVQSEFTYPRETVSGKFAEVFTSLIAFSKMLSNYLVINLKRFQIKLEKILEFCHVLKVQL